MIKKCSELLNELIKMHENINYNKNIEKELAFTQIYLRKLYNSNECDYLLNDLCKIRNKYSNEIDHKIQLKIFNNDKITMFDNIITSIIIKNNYNYTKELYNNSKDLIKKYKKIYF